MNMAENLVCTDCMSTFKTVKSLNRHRKGVKICQDYKNVLFTCLKCSFETKGLKNIGAHTCEGSVNIASTVASDSLLKFKIAIYEEIIHKYTAIDLKSLTGVVDKQSHSGKIEVIFKHDLNRIVNRPAVEVAPVRERCIPDPDTDPDPEKESSLAELDRTFQSIRDSRKYVTHIESISGIMKNLMRVMTICDYQALLRKNKKCLEDLLEEKGFTPSKIARKSLIALSPMDMRLLRIGNYTNTTLEVDDLNRFESALVLQNSDRKVTPFDVHKIYANIENYGLALFSLRKCMEIALTNSSVAYVDLPKSNDDDPYSFYILESIKGEGKNRKNKWSMDCRLEDTSVKLSSYILPYCITLFRRLYSDVFSDNIFRENYSSQSQTLENDAEQLLHNIVILSDHKDFCKLLQEIVKGGKTMVPTTDDKLNFYSDDKSQCRNFNSYKREVESRSTIMAQLFDEISSESAIQLYRRVASCVNFLT